MKLRQVCDRKLRLIYCDTGKPGRSYLISPADIEGLMQEKIHWITNLRGIACMMVVMIHSTSWYITHPMRLPCCNGISPICSIPPPRQRAAVFMISGYLFLGTQRPAAPFLADWPVHCVL